MADVYFIVGSDGYPVPISAPEQTEYAMTTPYPGQLWREESSYNNGYPFNMSTPEYTEYAMTIPYPGQLWRVEKGWNGGYPFHMLLPGIEYYNPPGPSPAPQPERRPLKITIAALKNADAGNFYND